MMLMKNSILFIFFLAMVNPASAQNVHLQTHPIKPSETGARGYIFSADESSFFFGTTAPLRDNPWMGLTVEKEKLFDDIRLKCGDRVFDRSTTKANFWAQGVSFTSDSITFVLNMAAHDYMRLIALSETPQDYSLELVFAPGVLKQRNVQRYEDALTIAPPAGGKYFIAVAWSSAEALKKRAERKPQQVPDSLYSFGPFYGPLSYHILPPDWTITYAMTEEEALNAARRMLSDRGSTTLTRRNILRTTLTKSAFQTTNPAVEDALRRVKKSLIDLQAAQGTELWAGFPWFNEAWGRDTFISLPGALLVTGDYATARKMLLQFARWQDKDSTSQTFGRIPNRARADEIVFNTADGTPWWIRSVYEYCLYSGDWSLAEKLLTEPSTKPGRIEGALRLALRGALSRADTLGFICHGDAETWMDAVGPDGAWSPRGNRAVEVQALWYAALDAALRMAAVCSTGVPDNESISWFDARKRLTENFVKYFIRPDGLGLYDHLNADGTPDKAIRPNQIFALTAPLTPLLSEETAQTVLRTVVEKCTYSYGVASLSQADDNFHPFHLHENYPKDAAYHNGTVWQWLSGPVKSILVSSGHGALAWDITQVEQNEILDGRTVGTLPELYDAIPQKGDAVPRTSGCVSQAWSLAEYCRVFYQDFLGIRPIQLRGSKQTLWRIFPRIPNEWGHTEVRVHFGDTPVNIEIDSSPDSVRIKLHALKSPQQPIPLEFFAHPNGIRGRLQGSAPVEVVWIKARNTIEVDGVPVMPAVLDGWPYKELPDDLHFATPHIRKGLRSLQEPDHTRFSGEQITATNSEAELIVALDDPQGDDVGDGNFTYPTDPHFEPGILDLTHYEVRADKKNLYFTLRFRNLVQPGWHPEYGFQLTFAAIAIRSNCSDKNPCNHTVGANAGVTLPPDYEANRFIYVGGGLRVTDGQNKTLAEFIPTDARYPIGDVSRKEIHFALPRKLFRGNPATWKYSVFIGAQDDHGGAGLGEFRLVEREAGRWVGGGGEGTSRVYDSAFWPLLK